jgi:chaperonin GroEL (HSP60 family)
VCVCCRDAVNDLALHYLAKMKVLVVRDVEREDVEFISRVRPHPHDVIVLPL